MMMCDAKMDVTYHQFINDFNFKTLFLPKNTFFPFISRHLFIEWYVIANVNVDANMTNYRNLPLVRLRYRFFIF